MTDEEKNKKYRCSVCYCQDEHCGAIFDARVLSENPEGMKKMFDNPPLLPCGHKLHSIVFNAQLFREGRKAEDRVQELERRIRELEG